MAKKKQLTEFERRNDDAIMCGSYYFYAVEYFYQFKAGPGATEVPYHGRPFSPEEFGESIGNRPFTHREYLSFLGEQGVDVDKIKAIIALMQQRTADADVRAKAFFDIFKTEWLIEQSDIDRYIDPSTIHTFIQMVVSDTASTKARLKAVKRHTENRAMKQDVFAWLDENMVNFKSMDSAAESVARTVAPIKFRTARDWVGEWKKTRSASTP